MLGISDMMAREGEGAVPEFVWTDVKHIHSVTIDLLYWPAHYDHQEELNSAAADKAHYRRLSLVVTVVLQEWSIPS